MGVQRIAQAGQKKTTFKKGNPGKPKGAVNKNQKLIKEVFADAFYALQNDPKHNLVAWAKENPSDFYKLGIRLVPTQMTIVTELPQVTIFQLPENERS